MTRSLLYVLNHYSNTASSHFAHIPALLTAIAQTGIDVRLLVEKGEAPDATPHVPTAVMPPASALRRQLALFSMVLKAFRRNPATVVYVRISLWSTLVAIAARSVAGSGSVAYWQSGTTFAGFDSQQSFGLKKIVWWIRSRLPMLLVIRFVDLFVTGPDSMIAYYRDVVGVPQKKLVLLFNDVDLRQFVSPIDTDPRRQEFRRVRGLSDSALIVLLVHRLSPVRRTHLYFPMCVVALCDRVGRDVRVVVVGDGPELERLRALAVEFGVGDVCEFVGARSNGEVKDFYAVADIFINPSQNEGFPRVILEAMAFGLPIVATDAGGTRDIFGTLQSAYVTPRLDPNAFAMRLADLAEDPTGRAALSAENLESVKQYDTRAVAEMYGAALFPRGD